MRQKGLIISYLRTRLSDRILDFGEDLQLWVERNLDKRFSSRLRPYKLRMQLLAVPAYGVQSISSLLGA